MHLPSERDDDDSSNARDRRRDAGHGAAIAGDTDRPRGDRKLDPDDGLAYGPGTMNERDSLVPGFASALPAPAVTTTGTVVIERHALQRTRGGMPWLAASELVS